MGQIHNEIRSGWLSEAVRRALGVTREAGVERFSETLDVVLNPWGMPEWAYLRGERLASSVTFTPAVAAEFGSVGLLNPVGSNMIVVVEGASAMGAAMNINLRAHSSAQLLATLVSTTTGFVRDRRWQDSSSFLPRAVSLIGSDTGVIAGQPVEQFLASLTFSSAALIAMPVILPPGHGVALTGQVVNTAFTACFSWRERAAYPGELA